MMNINPKCLINALALLIICAPGPLLHAQQATRIADLNPGAVGSFPSNFTAYGNALYFTAYTYELGRELWKYDGNVITLVSNINDATHFDGSGQAGNDSAPYGFTLFNGLVYFTAYDQRRGGELWSFDGTRAVRVADINPDINDQIKTIQNSSWPQELTVFNNALYFSADKGTGIPGPSILQNFELHRYDGTRVSLVTNIHTDFGTNYSSYPNQLTVFNGALYFMADDGANGYELWKHDAQSTVLFANINPGGPDSSSSPRYFTPYKNKLYFQAYRATYGFELWQTDGTNTSLVRDLNPTGSSSPEHFIIFQNVLFFCANDGTNGVQLWKYDGSSLARVTQFTPGYTLKNLTIFQDSLYFAANDGALGWELWKYTGTSTVLAADLNPSGDSFPEDLIVWDNKLFFTATNAAIGYEMWSYDGTVATAFDIFPGPPSSFPFNPGGLGSRLCFSANDSWFYDWEPWSIKSLPLQITGLSFVNPGVRIDWKTSGGTTNIVQTATNLSGPFQNVSGPIVISGSTETETNYVHQDQPQPGGTRFYRIVRP